MDPFHGLETQIIRFVEANTKPTQEVRPQLSVAIRQKRNLSTYSNGFVRSSRITGPRFWCSTSPKQHAPWLSLFNLSLSPPGFSINSPEMPPR